MLVLKGAVIPVVDPVEQHAERIEVDGGIRSGHNVGKLRRGIGTEILFRNGGVLQILQRGQTEIAELETAGSCQKYVLRLQIGKEITSLTAGGKRFAQIQTEIDRAQTRHSALGKHSAQRDLTGIEYVDIIADAGFLRLDLTAHRSQKVAGGSKLLPDGDLGYLMTGYWGGASFDSPSSHAPHELPTRGTGYYGTPAVCAMNEQGNDLVKLSYVSHVITAGKKKLEGLPAVYTESDAEATSLVITMADPLTGLTVELQYSVLEDLDALTRSMRLVNAGAENLTLTHMQSASVPLYGCDYDYINLNGGWARERAVCRNPVGHATVRVESQRGASGHEQSPFIAVCEKAATEHSGSVWAMALVYSGSFLAVSEVNNFDNTRISIGLNPEVCRWRLEPKETFQTPEAIMV